MYFRVRNDAGQRISNRECRISSLAFASHVKKVRSAPRGFTGMRLRGFLRISLSVESFGTCEGWIRCCWGGGLWLVLVRAAAVRFGSSIVLVDLLLVSVK